MSDAPLERYPDDRPRAATIRSRVMLEVASELAGSLEWAPKQAMVRMRSQGEATWSFTLFGSDSPGVVEDVGSGAIDVAIVNPATAAGPALRGVSPFSQPIPIRAIATIPSHDQLGFIVRDSSGIERLEDLADHSIPLRVSLRGGRPDHSVHMVLDHVLAALGTSLSALAAGGHTIGYDAGLPHHEVRSGLLERGEVDLLCDEGVYNWVELALDAGYRFLPIPGGALDQLERMGYRRGAIERERYPRLDADVATLDFSGFMIYTLADAEDAMIIAFCRALITRRDRIPWQGGPSLPLERMVIDAADAPIPIPFHPAAEQFWREAGILKGP